MGSRKPVHDGRAGASIEHNAKHKTTWRRASLCIIAFTISNILYFAYGEIVCTLFHRGIEFLRIKAPGAGESAQNEFMNLFLLILVAQSWSSFFSQSFDGDAFGHLLYWKYKLINTGEVACRVAGSLIAGGIFGYISDGLLRPSSEIVSKGSANYLHTHGSTKREKFFMLFTMLADSFLPTGYRNGPSDYAAPHGIVPDLQEDVGKIIIGDYLSAVFRTFFAELLFSVVVYMALSVSVVCHRVSENFSKLYIILKRFSLFIGNSYLKKTGGSITLNAAVSLMKYFEERDPVLLFVRVLANYLAVHVAVCLFNPSRFIRYDDFEEVYANVRIPPNRSVFRRGESRHRYVDASSVEYKEVCFTRWPDTLLGRLLSRIEGDCVKHKSD